MERINKLKDFLTKQPGDSFLQHALALEYVKLGEETMARQLFENILTKEPSYVGSYYHLGKLLERQGLPDEALKIYETGMQQAKAVKDMHAYSELQGAYDDIAE